MPIELSDRTGAQCLHQGFLGAGMGAVFSQAISYIGPACRMTTPAGVLFGAVFSLARWVDLVVLGSVMMTLEKIFEKNAAALQVGITLLAVVGSYGLRGAVALGVTILVFPGITAMGAAALTGTFLAVDILSSLIFDQSWMFFGLSPRNKSRSDSSCEDL